MKDRLKFLNEFIKSWSVTGSVTPSSRFLTRKMLSPIDFSRAKLIVELGSGEGSVTRAILKQMSKDAKLFCFEINPEFCRILKGIRDSRLKVINDSAENLCKYVKSADYVVSSLPLGSLPENTGSKII